MPTDLALNKATGDLSTEPNNDISIVTGAAVIDQRIRIRLKIPHGDWEDNLSMDTSELGIGSRLHEMVRLPMERAFNEIPLVVKEALEPMTDIRVSDVVCALDELEPAKINFTIYYTVLEGGGESDVQTFTDGVTFEGVS